MGSALYAITAFAVAACTHEPPAPPVPDSVTLSATRTALVVGEAVQITGAVFTSAHKQIPDATITYQSLNPSVVTVTSGGLVTAVGPGTATVTGTSSGVSGSLDFLVRPPVRTLNIVGAGSGSGTVTSNPPGIACAISNGSSANNGCAAPFDSGALVTLTATAVAGSEFAGWDSRLNCQASVTCPLQIVNGGPLYSGFLSQVVNASALQPQQDVANLVAPQNSVAMYAIAVPSGATALQVTTSGGSGDANLYLRFGKPPVPRTRAYDFVSNGPTTNEQLAVANPNPGTWYLALDAAAAFSGVTLRLSLSGGQVAVASVTLEPAAATVAVQGTLQLTATPRDASGAALAGRSITFESSAPAVATVSATGLVSGLTPGTTDVTASSEGKTSNVAKITVSGTVPVATVELTPPTATIAKTLAIQLTAVPRDAAGNALNGRTIEFTSSDPTIAAVNGSGSVVGVAVGTAVITARCEGKTAQARIDVVAAVKSISVQPSDFSLSRGETQQLTVHVDAAPGISQQVTYFVANPSIASVSAGGLVTALGEGKTAINVASSVEPDSIGRTTITVSGRISGRIQQVSPSGTLSDIVGVIRLKRKSNGAVTTGNTGSDGRFVFNGVASGSYDLEAQATIGVVRISKRFGIDVVFAEPKDIGVVRITGAGFGPLKVRVRFSDVPPGARPSCDDFSVHLYEGEGGTLTADRDKGQLFVDGSDTDTNSCLYNSSFDFGLNTVLVTPLITTYNVLQQSVAQFAAGQDLVVTLQKK